MALVKCRECKGEVSTEAKTCPKCGTTKFNPSWTKNPTLNMGCGLLLLMMFGWCGVRGLSGGGGPTTAAAGGSSTAYKLAHSSEKAPARPPSIAVDDLSLLIAKYGAPDVDDSTQNDDPRPPMVTRWIVFKKERVRATYLADAPPGSSPPFDKWKLIGFQDERSKEPLTAAEATGRLKSRAK
jgi:hypothetical protein